MFDGLFIMSIIGSAIQLIKESGSKKVAFDNVANKELYNNDILDGVSYEQRTKNMYNGKYKQLNNYTEPHRNSNGKIIIENCKLFEQDKQMYGVEQTYKWMEQGKYNLTSEEVKKENERIDRELEYLFSLC